MSKKIFLVLLTLASIVVLPVGARAQQAETLSPADCSSFYKPGSVEIEINSQAKSVGAGSQIGFSMNLVGNNDYPITDGSVYLKIFQKQSSGNLLVDQIVSNTGIFLGVKETKSFEYIWDVPAFAPAGDYKINAYFQSTGRFNISGLNYSDNIFGSSAAFKVVSKTNQAVKIINSGFKLNGKAQDGTSLTSQFSKDEKVIAEIPIINQGAKTETAEITYELYWWDNLQSSQKIDGKQETVTLNPKETKILKYEITDTKYPVYFLVTKAKWHDFTSQLDARFFRTGVTRPRIDFMGIEKFPLKAGEANSIMGCLSSTGLGGAINGKVDISIFDNTQTGDNATAIKSYSYSGNIDSGETGLKVQFTPEKDLTSFKLVATVYDGQGNKTEQATTNFDCKEIKPEICGVEVTASTTASSTIPTGIKDIAKYVIYGVIFIVIVALGVFIARRKKNTNQVVGYSILLIGALIIGFGFGGLRTVEAAKTASVTLGGMGPVIVPLGPVGSFNRGNFSFWFNRPTQTVTAKMMQGGVDVSDRTEFLPGSVIDFTVDKSDFPDPTQTLSWTSPGPSFVGDRFGHWLSLGQIPTPTCSDSDKILELSDTRGGVYKFYAPWKVEVPFPPKIQIQNGTGVLTCGSLRTTPSKYYFSCTVGNDTTKIATANVIFENHGQSNLFVTYKRPVGTQCFQALEKSHPQVSSLTVSFSVRVRDRVPVPLGNVTAPSITGPTSGVINGGVFEGTFQAYSTSSVALPRTPCAAPPNCPITSRYIGNITYSFDWDPNSNTDPLQTVSEDLSFSNSSNPIVVNHTWNATGTFIFKVMADVMRKVENSDGANRTFGQSDWSSFMITINSTSSGPPGCTPTDYWSACTASCGGGKKNLIHIAADCSTSVLSTSICNTQKCGTTIIEVPPG